MKFVLYIAFGLAMLDFATSKDVIDYLDDFLSEWFSYDDDDDDEDNDYSHSNQSSKNELCQFLSKLFGLDYDDDDDHHHNHQSPQTPVNRPVITGPSWLTEENPSGPGGGPANFPSNPVPPQQQPPAYYGQRPPFPPFSPFPYYQQQQPQPQPQIQPQPQPQQQQQQHQETQHLAPNVSTVQSIPTSPPHNLTIAHKPESGNITGAIHSSNSTGNNTGNSLIIAIPHDEVDDTDGEGVVE